MPFDTTTIPDHHDRTGAKAYKYFKVTGPSSYATGGEALNFGLSNVELLIAEEASNGTDLRTVQFDYVAKKLKWFTAAGAEIGAATDLSSYSCRVIVIGH